MSRTIKRGRPLGAKAFAIVERVRQQPVTLRELSTGLQLSYQDSAATVRNLVASGHVRYGATLSSTGGRSPRLIEPASATAVVDLSPLTSLLLLK
jgi:hypothetical protein